MAPSLLAALAADRGRPLSCREIESYSQPGLQMAVRHGGRAQLAQAKGMADPS